MIFFFGENIDSDSGKCRQLPTTSMLYSHNQCVFVFMYGTGLSVPVEHIVETAPNDEKNHIHLI